MAIVEAKTPSGELIEFTEVNLSTSGLLIILTDTDGNQAFVHRFAWEGIVNAVQTLFEDEKRAALADVKEMNARGE